MTERNDDEGTTLLMGERLSLNEVLERLPDPPPEMADPGYNPLSFGDVLNLVNRLHEQKQADYGRPTDPFANVRASEDFGIPGWVGALVRANDKMRRLQKAAQGGELANERVFDSLLDLATYALIAGVLFSEDAEWMDWDGGVS